MEDKLILGGKEFKSRFILGSGKYNLNLINAAVEQGGAEIITLALRRANTKESENILDYIPKGVTLLPNTSGARNAEEAVRIARLSRAMGCGDFVKIEIMRDAKYLFPDNQETIKATEILAKEGFVVLPYRNPDLNVARDLQNAGAAAVMPLAAPIGSDKGLATKAMIQVLIDEIDLPVIVDAGIGKPSQACEAMEMGAAAMSFPTIALTGARTSMPHGVPSDAAVQAGDFVLMDFGAMVNGYHSDMTRTVCVGTPTEKMKSVYEVVRQAQAAALQAARAGITGKALDAIARDIITAAGYGKQFGHSLGHGVGMDIHEYPNAAPSSHVSLEPGNVVTIEPGIYLPGEFGVRIEDFVVITETGCRNLTAVTPDLICIPAK